MDFKEGEIIRYADRTAEIMNLGPYADDFKNKILIRYYGYSKFVDIKDIRKATKEDIHAHKYLTKFAEEGRKLNEYKRGDVVSFHDNIQEVYEVRKENILILEDGPVNASEVIPVCFKHQRLDV